MTNVSRIYMPHYGHSWWGASLVGRIPITGPVAGVNLRMVTRYTTIRVMYPAQFFTGRRIVELDQVPRTIVILSQDLQD